MNVSIVPALYRRGIYLSIKKKKLIRGRKECDCTCGKSSSVEQSLQIHLHSSAKLVSTFRKLKELRPFVQAGLSHQKKNQMLLTFWDHSVEEPVEELS